MTKCVKPIRLLLPLFAIGLCFVSCKQEQTNTTIDQNYKGGISVKTIVPPAPDEEISWLSFASIEVLDSLQFQFIQSRLTTL